MTSRHQPNMVKMTISKPGSTYQRCGVPAFFEMKYMTAPTASVKAADRADDAAMGLD